MARRAYLSLSLAALLACRALAQNPSNIAGGVSEIEFTGFTVISAGWAESFNTCFFGASRGSLSGAHDILDGGIGAIASGTISTNPYEGSVSGSTIYEHCYQGRIQVRGDCSYPEDTNVFHSGIRCAPAEPRDREPIILCDDGSYTGQCSPIVINLQPGRYALSGAADPVDFDIDANGSPDRITWTARGSAVAFLAFDRNGNTAIDNGAELFGTATLLRSGARAPNGFEALKEFDTNADGVVDARDARWSALLLWTDANHDGVSQPSEQQRIAGSAVEAIETRYHSSGRRDPYGNLFRYQGLAHLAGSRTPIYDVFFRIVN